MARRRELAVAAAVFLSYLDDSRVGHQHALPAARRSDPRLGDRAATALQTAAGRTGNARSRLHTRSRVLLDPLGDSRHGGPWFQNLPHAGGIGQAILQSAADGLLLVAIWRRIGSMWIALATVIIIATAPFDLSLAAIVWNPTMGSTLAKVATALTLLNWHRGSTAQAVAMSAVAWMAVHAYTGAIYVTVAVFATALVDPFAARGNVRP